MKTMTYQNATLEYADGHTEKVKMEEITDFAGEVLRELQRQVAEHLNGLTAKKRVAKKRVAKKVMAEAIQQNQIAQALTPWEYMVRAPESFLQHLKGRYPGLTGWECCPEVIESPEAFPAP